MTLSMFTSTLNESIIAEAGPTDPSSTDAAPSISVVIPSHGRRGGLPRCLEALCAQTLSREQFEVIVCDDGSAHPIAPDIAQFGDRLSLTVVQQPQAGPAAARNFGASHAAARYLAFTDDDCVPARDWLERLLARFDQQPGHLLGGAIVNLLPDDPYATGTQLIMDYVYDESTRNGAHYHYYSTTNLAMPADRFWELGGFAVSFPRAAGEDYDLCARWHHAGFPSEYASEAVMGHAHGHTFASYLRQHFNYGRGLLRVRQREAERSGKGHLKVERAAFYLGLVRFPLMQTSRPLSRRLQYAMLAVLAQAATAVGAMRELAFGSPAPARAEQKIAAPVPLERSR
jgi:glycosyltransferase involved in cell wall biosynthesis